MRRGRSIAEIVGDNWLYVLIFAPTLIPVVLNSFTKLSDWPAPLLLSLIIILLVVALIFAILVFWRNINITRAKTKLLEQMLNREMTVNEIERLLNPNHQSKPIVYTDEEAIGMVAEILGSRSSSSEVMEEIMATMRASDSETKRIIAEALYSLIQAEQPWTHGSLTDKQILSVVHGLKEKPKSTETNLSEENGTAIREI